MVVPFGFASHADRVRADGQAAGFIRRGMQGPGVTPAAGQVKAHRGAADELVGRDDHEMRARSRTAHLPQQTFAASPLLTCSVPAAEVEATHADPSVNAKFSAKDMDIDADP